MAGKKRGSTEKNKGEAERKEEEKMRMRRGSSAATEPESPTPVKRPSRERKEIERFLSTPSSSTLKPVPRNALSFGQGSGTKLKDIPPVSLNIRKYKFDENLQVLHNILYGNETKDRNLKSNILKFSGFVWGENEAKLRARVKKMLDKCNKEILLEFCVILDIECAKAFMKKEEISAMLMEFLESPCVTTGDIPSVKKAKQRMKVKEMLNKCNEEILLDFCEILDIEPGKASTEKEEISVKLIKILESSCITTEVVPAAKNGKRTSKENIETILKASLVRKTKRQIKSENQLAVDEDESEDTVDSNDPSESSSDHNCVKSCDSEPEVEESDHDESEQEEEESDHDQSEQEEEEGDHDESEQEEGECEQKKEESDLDESQQEEEESDEGEPAEIKGSKGKQLSSSKSSSKDLRSDSGMKSSSAKKSKRGKKESGNAEAFNKEAITHWQDFRMRMPKRAESSTIPFFPGNVKSAENLNNGLSTSDLNVAVRAHMYSYFPTLTFGKYLQRLGDHFNVDLTDRSEEVKELTMKVLQKKLCFDDKEEKDHGQEGSKCRSDSGMKSSSAKKSKRGKKQSVKSEAFNKEQRNVKSAENLNNGPSTSDLNDAIAAFMYPYFRYTKFRRILRIVGEEVGVDLTDRSEEVKELIKNALENSFFGDQDDEEMENWFFGDQEEEEEEDDDVGTDSSSD